MPLVGRVLVGAKQAIFRPRTGAKKMMRFKMMRFAAQSEHVTFLAPLLNIYLEKGEYGFAGFEFECHL